MKTFLTIFMLISYLAAQNEVDRFVLNRKFPDESQKYLIEQYRLPKWGYGKWILQLSGSFRNLNFEKQEEQKQNKDFRVNVWPMFQKYFESEQTIWNYTASLNSRLNNNHQIIDKEDLHQRTDSRFFRTNLIFDGFYKQYYKSQFFLKLSTHQLLSYEEMLHKVENTSTQTRNLYIRRTLHPVLRIGLGWGKVRKVNPVFRALAFNEIWRVINNGQSLSEAHLKEMATFFAQRSSFFETYSRPDKYFYFYLPEGVRSQMDQLSAWQIFYLHDSWQQLIGERFEELDGELGMVLSYKKNIYAKKWQNQELLLIGGYFEQNYFHNVTLKYQIGVNVYTSFSQALNHNTNYRYFGKGSIRFSNLYNLLDRLLANLDFEFQTVFAKSKENNVQNIAPWQRLNRFASQLNLNYLIENKVLFNFNISYVNVLNHPENLGFEFEDQYYYALLNAQELTDLKATLGLTYFFQRVRW